LVLLTPFTLLPWNFAYGVWLGMNLVLFAVLLWAMADLAGLSYRESPAIFLVAAVLSLAPFHTGIVTANVTVVAVELSVIAIWVARRHHDILTALLLALATALKPQIGFWFLLYYFLRRRWLICGVAAGVLACLTVLGLSRLELGHTPWLSNYPNDNHILLESGVLGNFTAINPTRFGLINLQVALYPLLGDVQITNAVSMAIGAILVMVWLVAMIRTGRPDDREFLDLSAIAVISVLPVYHRFYDAALLVLPLCCAVVLFRKARIFASLSLLLMLAFLVPGGTLLETMQLEGHIPPTLAHRWWWESFVMAHQVWLLLLLSLLLLGEQFLLTRGDKHVVGGET
jgi:hypothetical protein